MEAQEDDLLNDEKEYAETEKRKNEIIGILIITLGILSLISIFTSLSSIIPLPTPVFFMPVAIPA